MGRELETAVDNNMESFTTFCVLLGMTTPLRKMVNFRERTGMSVSFYLNRFAEFSPRFCVSLTLLDNMKIWSQVILHFTLPQAAYKSSE